MDIQQEMEQLRRELVQANYEYYVQDNPTMSDYDYDHKLRRLEGFQGHPGRRPGGRGRHREPAHRKVDSLAHS